jgi:hypothetical protein
LCLKFGHCKLLVPLVLPSPPPAVPLLCFSDLDLEQRFSECREEGFGERVPSATFVIGSFVGFHQKLVFFFFSLWDWSLNLRLGACKADTVLLEPHLQSILFWIFWRWVSGTELASNLNPPNLSLPNITGVSHWRPTGNKS